MYVKLKDNAVEKFPYSIGDLKKDNPNVSFPKVFSSEIMATFGIAAVTVEEKPSFNSVTQTVSQKTTPELSDGKWVLKWDTNSKAQSVIDTEKSDQQNSIRRERNTLLSQSDWSINSDSQLTEDEVTKWKAYRQELRDATKQTSFAGSSTALPFVSWPTKPATTTPQPNPEDGI
tara:strand:- start:307 stop:828 length:522 start_codon:yes stop_codon:yes gene_type:complete